MRKALLYGREMASMNFGVRLSDDERALVEAAAKAEMQLGDRGGASSWVRKVILREAKRVLDKIETPVRGG